jgi:hypothetical protein
MSTSEFIRVKEAAQLLGVTTRTVHRYRELGFIKARRLPSRTVPRFRLFLQSVLQLIDVGGQSPPGHEILRLPLSPRHNTRLISFSMAPASPLFS